MTCRRACRCVMFAHVRPRFCMQKLSDVQNTDQDGNSHNSHPQFQTDLVLSFCGLCALPLRSNDAWWACHVCPLCLRFSDYEMPLVRQFSVCNRKSRRQQLTSASPPRKFRFVTPHCRQSTLLANEPTLYNPPLAEERFDGVHGELVVRCSVCSMCVSSSFPPATAAQCGYLQSLGMLVSDHEQVPRLLIWSRRLSLVRLAFVHIEKWLHNSIWTTRITAGQHSLTDAVSWRLM